MTTEVRVKASAGRSAAGKPLSVRVTRLGAVSGKVERDIVSNGKEAVFYAFEGQSILVEEIEVEEPPKAG